ncbi:hypothetical protein ACHAO1_003316 [Botrytis cinerea]
MFDFSQYPESITAQGKIPFTVSKRFKDAHSLTSVQFIHKGPRTVREVSSLSRASTLINSGLSNAPKFDAKSMSAESFGRKQLKQHMEDFYILVAKVEGEHPKPRMLEVDEEQLERGDCAART